MPNNISAPAVAATGVGALFLWSGITNRKVTDALRSLLAGEAPAPGGAYPLANNASSAPTGVGSASVSPAVGGIYTNSQLQSLWIMAGGNPSKAAVAAC